MGRLLKAHCSNCGYESGLLRTDTGRRSGATYFGVPARCYEEQAVVTVNLRARQAQAEDEAGWDDLGFGTAALESGDQDAVLGEAAYAHESDGDASEQTFEAIRRDMHAQSVDQPYESTSVEEPEDEEARLDYEAANPVEPPADEYHGADSGQGEAREQWIAELVEDPGPVEDDTAGEMEPAVWFPGERRSDPGPAAGAAGDQSTLEIPVGPWTIRDRQAQEEDAEQPQEQRAIAAETRTSFGLVATPVEPRATMPLTAEQGGVSEAGQRSLEFTGGAQVMPEGGVVAYPCPNDGSATTLYEAQAEDLGKQQDCPRCGEFALTFSVEGRWD